MTIDEPKEPGVYRIYRVLNEPGKTFVRRQLWVRMAGHEGPASEVQYPWSVLPLVEWFPWSDMPQDISSIERVEP